MPMSKDALVDVLDELSHDVSDVLNRDHGIIWDKTLEYDFIVKACVAKLKQTEYTKAYQKSLREKLKLAEHLLKEKGITLDGK